MRSAVRAGSRGPSTCAGAASVVPAPSWSTTPRPRRACCRPRHWRAPRSPPSKGWPTAACTRSSAPSWRTTACSAGTAPRGSWSAPRPSSTAGALRTGRANPTARWSPRPSPGISAAAGRTPPSAGPSPPRAAATSTDRPRWCRRAWRPRPRSPAPPDTRRTCRCLACCTVCSCAHRWRRARSATSTWRPRVRWSACWRSQTCARPTRRSAGSANRSRPSRPTTRRQHGGPHMRLAWTSDRGRLCSTRSPRSPMARRSSTPTGGRGGRHPTRRRVSRCRSRGVATGEVPGR